MPPFQSGRAFGLNDDEISGREQPEEQASPAPLPSLEDIAPKVVSPAPQPLENPWDKPDRAKARAAAVDPVDKVFDPRLAPRLAQHPAWQDQVEGFEKRTAARQRQQEQARAQALEMDNQWFIEAARRSGAKVQRGADGVARHATDDKGRPLFDATPWAPEDAPKDRPPQFLVRRNEYGEVEAKDAPVTHNKADPTDPNLYRDFGGGRMVRVGHVDDLRGSSDPAVAAAHAKLNEARQKDIAHQALLSLREQEVRSREESAKLQQERAGITARRAEIGQQRAAMDANQALSTEDREAREAAFQSEMESLAKKDRELAAKEPAIGTRLDQTRLERDALQLEFQKSRYSDAAETIRARLESAGKDPEKDPVYQAAVRRAGELNAGLSEVAKERAKLDAITRDAEKRAQDALGARGDSLEARTAAGGAFADDFVKQRDSFLQESEALKKEVEEWRQAPDPMTAAEKAAGFRQRQTALAARGAELEGARRAILSGQERVKAEWDARAKERDGFFSRGQAKFAAKDPTDDADGAGLAIAYGAALGGDDMDGARDYIEKSGATAAARPFVAIPGGGIVLHPDVLAPNAKPGTPDIAAVYAQAVKAGAISEEAARVGRIQDESRQFVTQEAMIDRVLTDFAATSQGALDTNFRDWIERYNPELLAAHDAHKIGITASPSDRAAFMSDPAMRKLAAAYVRDESVDTSVYAKDLVRVGGAAILGSLSWVYTIGGQVAGNLANLVGATSIEKMADKVRDVGIDADAWTRTIDPRIAGGRWENWMSGFSSVGSMLIAAQLTAGVGSGVIASAKLAPAVARVAQPLARLLDKYPRVATWLGHNAADRLNSAAQIALRMAGTTASSAGATASQMLAEMQQMGVLDQERAKSWAVMAAAIPIGATDVVPMEAWLGKMFHGPAQAAVRKTLLRSIAKTTKGALLSGGVEMVQETIQTGAENLPSKIIYDAKRELGSGIWEAAEAGGVVGVVMDLVSSAIGGARFAHARRRMDAAFVQLQAAREPIDLAFRSWRGGDVATVSQSLQAATGAAVSREESQAVMGLVSSSSFARATDEVEARRSAAEKRVAAMRDNAAVEPEEELEARREWFAAEQQSLAARQVELMVAGVVARGRQQALALPDFTEQGKDGVQVVNPATAGTFRQAAATLLKVAVGYASAPTRLSEADTQAVQTLGQAIGSEIVQWVPSKALVDGQLVDTQEAVVTDKARAWLATNVPASRALLQQSEVERRERIEAQTQEAEVAFAELQQQQPQAQAPDGSSQPAAQQPVAPSEAATVPPQPASTAANPPAPAQRPAPTATAASPVYAERFSPQAVEAKISEALATPVADGVPDQYARLRAMPEPERRRYAQVLSEELAAKSTALDYLLKATGGTLSERGAGLRSVSGGAQYVPGEGIQIDLPALLGDETMRIAGEKGEQAVRDRIERVFTEESIHLLGKQAITDEEMSGWYATVPEPLRRASWQAYNGGKDAEVGSPVQAGHELFRQMLQDRVRLTDQGLTFDDKVVMPSTEATGAFSERFKAFVAKLGEMLATFRKQLLADPAPEAQAAAKQYEAMETRVRELNERFRQGAGLAPAPAPATSTATAPSIATQQASAPTAAPATSTRAKAPPEVATRYGLQPDQTGHVETLSHRGQVMEVVPAIVEADSVLASHTYEGVENPGFPKDRQPRSDRGTNPQYILGMRRQMANPILEEDRKIGSVGGVPIVHRDEATGALYTPVGNGRLAAKQGMYTDPDLAPVAANYRESLVEIAAERGIDPAVVRRMKNPVMVRLIAGADVDTASVRELSRTSNVNDAEDTSAAEQAKVDAALLTPEVLALLQPGKPLTGSSNEDFLGAATTALYGRFGTTTVRADRAQRVERALFVRAFGDSADGRAAFDRLIRERDDESRNLSNALSDIAPRWAYMRALMESGALGKQYDITPAVIRAVQDISQAVANRGDKTVAEALAPLANDEMPLGDKVGAELEPEVRRTFLAARRSKTALQTALESYVSAVQAVGSPDQVVFPGMEDLRTPAQIWRDVNARLDAFAAATVEEQAAAIGGMPTPLASPQTETPEFKRWFGESRVVDASGLPLVVYHGTNADFREFSIVDGLVGWFTSAPDFAANFGATQGQSIYPVYLRIERPFDLSGATERYTISLWRRILEEAGLDDAQGVNFGEDVNAEEDREFAFWELVSPRFEDVSTKGSDLLERIKSAGYDGVFVPSERLYKDDRNFVVFDPTQVKSAIGNSGAFDPRNPSILAAARREDTSTAEDEAAAAKTVRTLTDPARMARDMDPRIAKDFADWKWGFNALGLPKPPMPLPVGHRLLAETDKKTVAVVTPEVLASDEDEKNLQKVLQSGGFAAGQEVPRDDYRTAVVKSFVDEAVARGVSVGVEVPEVVFMAGGPAAGKSTAVKKLGVKQKDYLTINADDVKARLPEYVEMTAGAAPDGRAAAIVHEESSTLAKALVKEVLARKIPTIYDAVLDNPRKALELIGRFRAAGFRVRILGVTTDPHEAMVRLAGRALKTGRWVPYSIALPAHKHVTAAFDVYAQEFGEAFALFENSDGIIRLPVDATIPQTYGTRDEARVLPDGADPRAVGQYPGPSAAELGGPGSELRRERDAGRRLRVRADASARYGTQPAGPDGNVSRAVQDNGDSAPHPAGPGSASAVGELARAVHARRNTNPDAGSARELIESYLPGGALAAPGLEVDENELRSLTNDALRRRERGEYAIHPIERIIRALDTLRSDSGDHRGSQAAGSERGRVRRESATRDRGAFQAAEAVARGGLSALRRPALADFPQESEVREVEEAGRGYEDAALRRWARANGILIDWEWFDSQWRAGGRKGGQEHDVFWRERDGRWWKRSTMPLTGPSWVNYFQRMQLHAALFPEAAYRLEGIALDHGGKVWVVTSQPNIIPAEGAVVGQSDVRAMMTTLGFEWKPVIAGRWGGKSGDNVNRYYHPALGLWVDDVHAGNVLRREAGGLAVIDPVLVVARRGALGAAMGRNLGVAFKKSVPADDPVDTSLAAPRVQQDDGPSLWDFVAQNPSTGAVEPTVPTRIMVDNAIADAKGDVKAASKRIKKAVTPAAFDEDLFGLTERLQQEEEARRKQQEEAPPAPKDNAEQEPKKEPEPKPEPKVESAADRAAKARAERAAARAKLSPDERNHRIESDADTAPGGLKARAARNIEALRTLKKIESEGRKATAAERQVLARFAGWGPLPQVFDNMMAARVDAALARFGPNGSLADLEYDVRSRPYMADHLQPTINWARQWWEQYKEVRALLTDAEWNAARNSTLNAHYTSAPVVRAMWTALQAAGFKGGRILDPSTGSGNFLGLMPEEVVDGSEIHAVELDPITGRLATQLYPEAQVQVAGFEDSNLPENYFDLAISNVPFAKRGPLDPRHSEVKLNLHNYFFAKALDKVRPGGLVAFITTHNTMDSAAEQREYLGRRAKFIGAVRLPRNAFKESASTEVVTDIIILQKGTPGPEDIHWMAVAPVGTATDSNGEVKGVVVNEYFREHPENVLGSHSLAGSMYGPDQYTVEPDGNPAPMEQRIADALTKALQGRGGYVDGEGATERKTFTAAKASWREGSFQVKDGEMGIVVGGEWKALAEHDPVRFGDEGGLQNKKRVASFVRLRDAYNAHMELQSSDATDEDVDASTKELAALYLQTVQQFGYLQAGRGKWSIVKSDPAWYFVQGLETVSVSEDPQSGKSTEVFYPSDVLKKRTYRPIQEPTRAESVVDALRISQAWRGRLDMDYIAGLLRVEPDDARSQLKASGLAFQDPFSGDMVPRDIYLSGNVRRKLRQAQAANKGGEYAANIEALQAVMPKPTVIEHVNPRLGGTWIDPQLIEHWLDRELGIKNVIVRHSRASAGGSRWSVDVRSSRDAMQTSLQKWGDEASGWSALDILKASLSMRRPLVEKEVEVDGKKRKVVDDKQTASLHAAQLRLESAWAKFVKSNSNKPITIKRDGVEHTNTIAGHILAAFDETFNSNVPYQADGSHLVLPGSAPFVTGPWDQGGLGAHQRNAIQRAVQDGYAYLAHGVGAGKTSELIAIAMEWKRLGIVKKPMIAVLNPTLHQFAARFREMYPNAKVLVATKEDLETENRRAFLANVRNNDWDAVVIAHSSFNAIKEHPADIQEFVEIQKREVEDALIAAAAESGDDISADPRKIKSQAVKDLVRQLNALEDKLKAALDAMKVGDDTVYFRDLMVDGLLVDEAHLYKKMPFVTMMDPIAGIDRTQSQRATNLLMRLDRIKRKNNGRGVVLATGTPITNTMGEAWNAVRATVPASVLKDFQSETFDQFVANFGMIETRPEMNAGGRVVMRRRLSKFANGQGLNAFIRSAMDVQMSLELGQPEIVGGGLVPVECPRTPMLGQYMKYLAGLYEQWESSSEKGDYSFIPLLISGATKAATLDLRLLIPNAPDDPNSKVNVAVRKMLQLYHESAARKATQLVFLDQRGRFSTEKLDDFAGGRPVFADSGDADDNTDDNADDDALDGGLNLWEDIRAKLIAAGVPASEVAVITDAKNDEARARLFAKVNAGTVRFLIGSTEKMGTGVNVQRLAYASHHLDVPWTPAGLSQRNGRAWRNGNLHKKWGIPIHAIYYGVKGSLDGTRFQVIETKEKFSKQGLEGRLGFEFDDPNGGLADDAGMMKALWTENPYVMKHVGLLNQLRVYELDREVFGDRVSAARRDAIELKAMSIKETEAGRVHAEMLKAIAADMPQFSQEQLDALHKKQGEQADIFEATSPIGLDVDRLPALTLWEKRYDGVRMVYSVNALATATGKLALRASFHVTAGDKVLFERGTTSRGPRALPELVKEAMADIAAAKGAKDSLAKELRKRAAARLWASRERWPGLADYRKLVAELEDVVLAMQSYRDPNDEPVASRGDTAEPGDPQNADAAPERIGQVLMAPIPEGFDGPFYHGSPDWRGKAFSREYMGRNTGLSRGGFSFTDDHATAEAYTKIEVDPFQDAVDAANKVLRELGRELEAGRVVSPLFDAESLPEFHANNIEGEEEAAQWRDYVRDELAPRIPSPYSERLAQAVGVVGQKPNPRVVVAYLRKPTVKEVAGRKLFLVSDPADIYVPEFDETLKAPETEATIYAGLYRENEAYALSIARGFAQTNDSAVDADDVAQEARIALVHAAETWDPAKGRPFRAYAGAVVRNRLRDVYRMGRHRGYITRNGTSLNAETDEGATPLHETIGDPAGVDPALMASKEDFVSTALSLIESLPERQRDVMRAVASGRTVTELAKDMGVSKQAVSVIHQTALAKLRKGMESAGVDKASVAAVLGAPQTEKTHTPEFKAWFGEWESVRNATPVRNVQTLEDARSAASAFVGDVITNATDDFAATVSNKSLDKMLSESAVSKSVSGRVHALAVANIDRLFRNAVRAFSGDDANGDVNVRSVHRYFAPLLVDGDLYAAKITVKEFARASEGARLYTVEALEIEKPAGIWTASVSETRRNYVPQAGFRERMRAKFEEVNPGAASRVVNPDGTPMVVYHGARPRGEIAAFQARSPRDGIYFTPDPEYAAAFTQNLGRDDGSVGAIYPVFVNLRNPYVVRGEWGSEEVVSFLNRGLDRQTLERQGYDGAMLYIDGQLDQVMVFSGNQVKSAIGNDGSFDRDDPSILSAPITERVESLFGIRPMPSAKNATPPVDALGKEITPVEGGGYLRKIVVDGLTKIVEKRIFGLPWKTPKKQLVQKSVPTTTTTPQSTPAPKLPTTDTQRETDSSASRLLTSTVVDGLPTANTLSGSAPASSPATTTRTSTSWSGESSGSPSGSPLSAPRAEPSADREAIAALARAFNAKLDPEAIATAWRTRAAQPAGAATIGRPDLANPATGKARELVDAVDEVRKDDLKRETQAQWEATGREMLAKDRAGVTRTLLEKASDPDTHGNLTPEETKAARILVDEMATRAIGGDSKALLESAMLTSAFRLARTEAGRALAAGKDAELTAAERHRSFLMDLVLRPSPRDESAAKAAPTAAEKSRQIEALKRQLRDLQKQPAQTRDVAQMRQLVDELGRLREQATREAILTKQAQGELDRVRKVLEKMGTTLEELLAPRSPVYLRLRGEQVLGDFAAKLPANEREALRMARRGDSAEQIEAKTGLTKAQQDALRERAFNDFLAKHEAKVRRMGSLADIDLGGSAPLGAPAMEGEAWEQRKRELRVLLGLSNDESVRSARKRILKPRKPGKKGPTPTPQKGGAGPIPTVDTGGKPLRGEGGNKQLELGEDPDAVPVPIDLEDVRDILRWARAIAGAKHGTGFDMAHEFWVASLLSGPKTQAANIAGNLASVSWEVSVQRAAEVAVNSLLNAFRMGDTAGAQVGDVSAMAKALAPALKKAWSAATFTWGAEVSIFEAEALDRQLTWRDIDSAGKGETRPGAIPGEVGRVIRIPMRLLLAADEFFKQAVGRVHAAVMAHRIATHEGLQGPARDRRIAQLMQPGSAAWVAAVQEAKRLTFNSEPEAGIPGQVYRAAKKVRDEVPLARYAIPFLRTPFAIFSTGMRKSPLGMAYLANRALSHGLWRINGRGEPVPGAWMRPYAAAEYVRHIAEQALAWGAAAALYAAFEGDDDDDRKEFVITGSRSTAPQGRAERDLLTRMGLPAYTVRMGRAQWNYARFEPIATVLGVTADTIRTAKLSDRTGGAAAMGALAGAMIDQTTNKTFLQGLSNIANTLRAPQQSTSQAADFVASWVPNLIRAPLRDLDPYIRDRSPEGQREDFAGNFAGRVASAVVPQAAPPKVDIYGREVRRAGHPLARAMIPGEPREVMPSSPVDRMLFARMRRRPGDAWAPSAPRRTLGTGPSARYLSRSDYLRYQKAAGRSLLERMSAAEIEAPSNPTDDDMYRLRRAASQSRDDAREQLGLTGP